MIAEIAAILHWQRSELVALELDELIRWHGIAVATWNRLNRTEKG